MSLGPIELLVVKFPGNEFKGEIIPALGDLVRAGTIRIIDILFAVTDDTGQAAVVELSDLDPDTYGEFDPIVEDLTGMLNADDVERLSYDLGPNSSAAIMLFENVWATRFRDAVLNANGKLVLSERIPKEVVDRLIAQGEAEIAAATA
jgi:hypothetical protein